MIHEAMILDHSGPLLGLIEYGSAIKLFVLESLILNLVLPLQSMPLWSGALLWIAGVLANVRSYRNNRIYNGTASHGKGSRNAHRGDSSLRFRLCHAGEVIMNEILNALFVLVLILNLFALGNGRILSIIKTRCGAGHHFGNPAPASSTGRLTVPEIITTLATISLKGFIIPAMMTKGFA